MAMQTVPITELTRSVRSFLSQVRKGDGIVVEDTNGRAWCGVIPCDEATLKEQEAALRRLARLQKKVGETMAKTGRTENEFDQLLRNKS